MLGKGFNDMTYLAAYQVQFKKKKKLFKTRPAISPEMETN